ncbi:MAG: hypothetical protein ACOX5R_09085 [bacterium]|jgi:hypothetical protein
MNEGVIRIIFGIFVLATIGEIFVGDDAQDRYQQIYQTMQGAMDTYVQATEAAEGLDLQALAALAKQTKTPEEFEKLLNQPGSINNLDLNQDGQVDYIRVTEYGTNNEKAGGLSLSVDLDENQTQEIATIVTEKVNEQEAAVEIKGNEQIYGANQYYHARFPLTEMLLLSFLLDRDRDPWLSPYRYGRYPSWYKTYTPSPWSTYSSRVEPMRKNVTVSPAQASRINTRINSPNAGKVAENIRAPLRNPTDTQKSFQARNPSQPIRSGGFGQAGQSGTVNQQGVRSGGFGRGSQPAAAPPDSQNVRSGGFGRSKPSSPPPSRPSVRKSSFFRGGSLFGGGK